MLHAFSKVLKDILEDYGPGCERCLLNSMPRGLKGRAYEAYGEIAPNYNSLDEFFQDLKLSFSVITDADTIKILLDMRQMEQNPGEPVADYALRVQNLEQPCMPYTTPPSRRFISTRKSKLEKMFIKTNPFHKKRSKFRNL